MSLRALRSRGHWPSLAAALMHFEVSFGVWVVLGALGPILARELGLSPAAKGLVVGTPLLAAAVFRVIVGWLADRYGPRRVGTITMTLTLAPLLLGWMGARSMGGVLAVGVLLGIAGASFAVAMPLASSHYPPSSQGLVLGIAGAGNSGTIITALVAPRVAEHVGWHATMGLACIPVALAAIAFRVIAREAPRATTGARGGRLTALRAPDSWRLCSLYLVTFGGYVGFTSYLSILLVDRFALSPVTAGGFAAAAAGAGSFMRPIGGFVADRAGGARVLAWVFGVVAVCAAALSALPPLPVTVALLIGMLGTLGTGNGAVFQLLALRFRSDIGVVTGAVGAAGGLGGFALPSLLGVAQAATGSHRLGFLAFAGAALIATIPMLDLGRSVVSRAEPAEAAA